MKTLASIDIGAGALRLAVAQHDNKELNILEKMVHPLRLGEDTFIRGYITPHTLEQAIEVLGLFSRKLKEFGVERIRVVATSAVREAKNRDFFLEQVRLKTGFRVQIVEKSEEQRLIFLGFKHHIKKFSHLIKKGTFFVKVGSGNVELSLIQQGNLIFSGSIPIGGLRLREHLKDVPMADFADVAEQYISSDMKMLAQGIPEIKAEFLVGAGSLLRWVHQILGHKKSILHKEELKELYQKFKTKSRELISEKYGVPSEYADLIAPSIYIYLELFKLTATDKIHFVDISFTDSLLMQQAGFFKNRYFSKKIWKSSIQLGRKYNFDEKHALQVSKLAGILFDGLQELHQLPIRYRFLLRLAGLWHDIGIFIKNSEHHKHSFYLISSIEMPGLSSKDLHMIATIARYHRNNIPKTYHKEYAVLSRQEKVLVSKLAAILRMADALDRSHRQAIKNLNIRFEGDKLILESEIPEVLWLEKLHFNRKKNLFTRVFGIESEFREVF